MIPRRGGTVIGDVVVGERKLGETARLVATLPLQIVNTVHVMPELLSSVTGEVSGRHVSLPPPGIGKPVVNLAALQASSPSQIPLLFFSWIRMIRMLV